MKHALIKMGNWPARRRARGDSGDGDVALERHPPANVMWGNVACGEVIVGLCGVCRIIWHVGVRNVSVSAMHVGSFGVY